MSRDLTCRTPAPRKHRRRRALKALALACLVLAALALAASWYVEWRCIARPPAIEGRPAIVSAPVRESAGVRRIGDSWLARKDGILRMYLAGDPFTLGYSNAALSRQYLRRQEEELVEFVHRTIPSPTQRWLLRKYVLWRNRDLPDFIAPEHQAEIYGLARGGEDAFPEIAPLYHRLVNYHAAHDIAHALMDHPLVACTSFAAWGSHTADGHLLMGRNFDFNAVPSFDANKIVMRVKPASGLGFLSVAWPGSAGSVTGMNDARIAIAVNAGQSADVRTIGTPVCLVVRRALQEARTLDEAVDIIRQSRVFVTDSYLVADGKIGKAVVVEKTPARCDVRPATGEAIICSNHFLCDSLKSDPLNARAMEETTCVARHARMEALIAAEKGVLTPPGAARILRDTRVAGDRDAGLGNPAAINMLIATHSVIMDATDGILWVSAGPHSLGPYVPFSLAEFDSPQGAAVLPADPILADGSYARYKRSAALVSEAMALMAVGRPADAEEPLEEAARLNPGFYVPPLLLGRIALARLDWRGADALLRQAQDCHIPTRAERAMVQKMREKIRDAAGAGQP